MKNLLKILFNESPGIFIQTNKIGKEKLVKNNIDFISIGNTIDERKLNIEFKNKFLSGERQNPSLLNDVLPDIVSALLGIVILIVRFFQIVLNAIRGKFSTKSYECHCFQCVLLFLAESTKTFSDFFSKLFSHLCRMIGIAIGRGHIPLSR